MTKIYFQKKASICLKKSKEKVRKQKTKCDTIELTWESRKLICKIEKWEEARGYDCNKSGRKHDSAFPRAT